MEYIEDEFAGASPVVTKSYFRSFDAMPLTPAMLDWIGAESIASFDKMRDADNYLPSPWRVFPTYRPTSMGWRMGVGETYMTYWHGNYQDLDAKEKLKYRRKYPAPLYWYWAYWNLESPVIAILVAITGLLTWIPRVPLHLIYYIFTGPRVEIPDCSQRVGEQKDRHMGRIS